MKKIIENFMRMNLKRKNKQIKEKNSVGECKNKMFLLVVSSNLSRLLINLTVVVVFFMLK